MSFGPASSRIARRYTRMATYGASGWLRLRVLRQVHGATRDATGGQRGVKPLVDVASNVATEPWLRPL